MPLPDPVIVVPGITATYLRDTYPLPPEPVWKVLDHTKKYERIAFHPDNERARLQYEAREPARIVSDQLYEVVYQELIEELRHNLQSTEDNPVPVYPFGYDWRQPLDLIEVELDHFVEEVIARTALMKNYFADGYEQRKKVNFVGHSMGGLVITGYLNRKGQASRAGKVVTLATPFQGSIEAVVKMVTGNANLGTTPPSSREREAARFTPALYHLLPSFEAGISIPPAVGTSVFDPAVWQRTIIDTIREYIRLYGREPGNADDQATNVFAELLAQAQKHRERIDTFSLAQANLTADQWLCVVGVDTSTRVRLTIEAQGQSGGPEFRFNPREDLANDWPNGGTFTGDGTVPFNGAVPKFLDLRNLVCVTPDDFDFWELKDKAFMKLAGFHGFIPTMNMLHRLIVRFFLAGIRDPRGDTWGRPAPGISDREWHPPIGRLPPRR